MKRELKLFIFSPKKVMIDHGDNCTPKNEPISVTLKDVPRETSPLLLATGPFQ